MSSNVDRVAGTASQRGGRWVGNTHVTEVAVTVPLDPYLSLKALAAYSAFSVRRLRDLLNEPTRPLPCYRVAGKVLVRRSEFDAWIASYRQCGRVDIDQVVNDALKGIL